MLIRISFLFTHKECAFVRWVHNIEQETGCSGSARQAGRQTDRQTGRQTGRQAADSDRQTDRKAGRQTDRQTDRQEDEELVFSGGPGDQV